MTSHHSANPSIVYSFPSTSELIPSLASFILKAQKEAIDKKGRFTVAISGGSLPKMLSGLIGNPAVKWDKWRVFYADERCVHLDSPDSNHNLCNEVLFSKVPIPESNIQTIDIPADCADPSTLDLEDICDAYEQKLIAEFAQKDAARFPVFDLLLLGIGPDGHTCSLFPGHELLAEEERWVAPIEDSPKPPSRRITLTYPSVNHAVRIAFVATGEGKADVLSAILDRPEEGLPASRVRPAFPGQVWWFVDDAASAKVQHAKVPFKLVK
jgi:6-phosphogluconolactonase